MIHVCTCCPKCYQMSHPHLACISYLKPKLTCRGLLLVAFSSFLALSSFQVRCVVPTSCVNTFQSTHHITPVQSPLPHHLTPRSLRVWILAAWLFCIRMSPRCNAFCISRHLCILLFWFASEVSLCRHRICLCSSGIDILMRQALSPVPSTSLPSPEAHTASHICDNCDDYLWVSPI